MKKLACLVLGAVLLNHAAVAQAPTPDFAKMSAEERTALYEQNIYGQQPAHTPSVRFEVTATGAGALGGQATRREVVGHIDNSRYPAATPRLAFTIYTPAQATKPVTSW